MRLIRRKRAPVSGTRELPAFKRRQAFSADPLHRFWAVSRRYNLPVMMRVVQPAGHLQRSLADCALAPRRQRR
jgi:hypothetical protein